MKQTQYLGMIMDEHFTFINYKDTVKLKLNRANGLLAKVKALYVNPALLRTIYYAIFEPPAIWMSINYGGKHKHKSYKTFIKSKTKP